MTSKLPFFLCFLLLLLLIQVLAHDESSLRHAQQQQEQPEQPQQPQQLSSSFVNDEQNAAVEASVSNSNSNSNSQGPDWQKYVPSEYQHFIPAQSQQYNKGVSKQEKKERSGDLDHQLEKGGGGRIKVVDEYTARVRARVEEREHTDIEEYRARERKVQRDKEHKEEEKKKHEKEHDHDHDHDRDHDHDHDRSHKLVEAPGTEAAADPSVLVQADHPEAAAAEMSSTVEVEEAHYSFLVLLILFCVLFAVSVLVTAVVCLRPRYCLGYSFIDGPCVAASESDEWTRAQTV